MITFEQIEKLKELADISFEEAKAILEKYDGDIIKATVELERQGKVRNNSKYNKDSKQEKNFMTTLKELFNKGQLTRFTIKRKEDVIVNLSINFTIVLLIFGFHIFVIGLVFSLFSGYKIKIIKEKGPVVEVDEFVSKASQNIKNVVNNMTETRKDTKTEDKSDCKSTGDYNEITIE